MVEDSCGLQLWSTHTTIKVSCHTIGIWCHGISPVLVKRGQLSLQYCFCHSTLIENLARQQELPSLKSNGGGQLWSTHTTIQVSCHTIGIWCRGISPVPMKRGQLSLQYCLCHSTLIEKLARQHELPSLKSSGGGQLWSTAVVNPC